ncbi:MAG: hypothetical protein E6J44_08540 [Chloroflexi bacterium]|nr:MAG: hypothetical protein E6J44_08540 [Chloroflexota bacterium]
MSWRPIYFLRLLMLCLCGLFLLLIAFSSRAFAASNPITITYQTNAVHFPGSIDFTMTANDRDMPISQATLFIRFKDTPDAVPEQDNVTISHPAKFITLHWHEDTSGNNFHSPGTPVEYYWELQDGLNNQYFEPPQDFITIDTRFSWQHLSQGLLQVNWYNRSQVFGQVVLDRANTSLTDISQKLGGGLLHPINLWIYASNEDFHGALPPNSYEWVGGEALPYLNEAFIRVVDTEDYTLMRDMPHELTHLVFHQRIAQGPLPPTWFDEGLAVYNQFYHEPEMQFRFNQALASHTLLRLSQISDKFPADADKAYLAYGQSWNLIDYMYSTFGQARMTLLIQNMNNPRTDFGEDLTQALGEDQVHLENQWRLHLNQPAILNSDQASTALKPSIQTSQPQSAPTDSTEPLFVTLGVLLILLPMAGIGALLVYQRRKRQQVLAVQQGQPSTIQYRPFTTPEQTFGRSPANVPPDISGIPSWQPDYPAINEGDSENMGLAPFVPFQENFNSQPRKKAPQE